MARIKINIEGGRRLPVNRSGRQRAPINAPMGVPQLNIPGSLSALDQSSSQINISWLAVDNATSYTLERSANGSTGWAVIYTGATTSYNNIGLTSSTTYYYRVKATAVGYISSDYSTIASGTTQPTAVDSPVIYRMTTSTDGTKVNIMLDRAMGDPTGLHASFSWKQNGVSRTFTAAALYGTKGIQLTCSDTIIEGDEVLITYTPGTIQATDGGSMIYMGDAPVLNCRTASDIPFFDNWDMIIDARDNSKFTLSGTNITRLFDKAATGRWFAVQSTAYATLDDAGDVISLAQGTTNEYTTEREIRKPASGRFTYVIKFKSPASGDPSAANTAYFLRHSAAGAVITSSWNATPARRNMRVFTTSDYYSNIIAESTIQNNDGYHYVVATYDGTTYKLWSNGTYVAKTLTISSVEMFNRIFQSPTSRAAHAIRLHAIGEYLSDADVSTLNTYLATA